MPMNPDIKKQWTENLLDPEAVQGYETLRDRNERQCCLDILNQMCSDAGMQPQPVFNEDKGYYEYSCNENCPFCEFSGPGKCLESNTLTRVTMLWAGTGSLDPLVVLSQDGYQGQATLSYLNDSRRMTFPEIAQAIEEDDSL